MASVVLTTRDDVIATLRAKAREMAPDEVTRHIKTLPVDVTVGARKFCGSETVEDRILAQQMIRHSVSAAYELHQYQLSILGGKIL